MKRKLQRGHIVYPYGSHRRGQLIYDQHGNMAVQIARFQRERFSADDKLQGTLEEFTGAFTSCEAYFGMYVTRNKVS